MSKMKKVRLPKKTVILDLAEDFGMDDYAGIKVEVWEDPSRMIIAPLLKTVMFTSEMSEKDAKAFYSAMSKFLIDINIDGVSFDTQDDVEAAFHSEDLPWGFMFELTVLLVARLLETNETIKKALMAFSDSPSSGPDNASEEDK